MSASTKTRMEDQPSKLGELFSKCSQLAAQEERELGRVVSTILPVLAYLDEPVVLRPESLGGAFRECVSVTLQIGAKVVTTDFEGNASSKPLAEFSTEECLAILHDAFPELQRLVADKRRAGQVMPALSVKVVLGGSHFILDMRSYRLVVSNSGGHCRGLLVSSQLPEGPTKPSRLRDVNHGEEVEVDLGVFKQVSDKESLELRIDCKDVDGRELSGDQSIRLDGASWQSAALSIKK